MKNGFELSSEIFAVLVHGFTLTLLLLGGHILTDRIVVFIFSESSLALHFRLLFFKNRHFFRCKSFHQKKKTSGLSGCRIVLGSHFEFAHVTRPH